MGSGWGMEQDRDGSRTGSNRMEWEQNGIKMGTEWDWNGNGMRTEWEEKGIRTGME